LPHAIETPFNSYNRQHEPICLPNTRVDLLQEIYNWADGHDERFIFWLNGLAGTGKSTIARTVSRRYYEQRRLGASFFFSRGGGDVGRAGKFVTSIAVQLANNIPPLRRWIYEAIAERSDIASQSLRDQWNQLVLHPLSKLSGDSCPLSYILVIDALDECDDDNDIRIILQILAEARSLKLVRLRVFLTSRREIPIRHGFDKVPEAEHQDFVLQNISPDIVDHDITRFLEYNLKLIREEFHLPSGWPSEQEIAALRQNASGLFIWAGTACRFIRAGKRLAGDRLSIILKTSPPMDDSADGCSTDDSDASPDGDYMISPEEKLNEIYLAVLKNSVQSYTKHERKKWYRLLKEATRAIVLLFFPLSALSLARLLGVRGEYIIQTLNDLPSILNIPEDPALPIRLHHPSFRDFLLDKGRCGSLKFWVDEKQAHRTLADSCIRLLSTALKEDICSVNKFGTLATDIESSRVEQCLPPEVQYACLYWVEHLQKSEAQLRDNEQVHQFLQKNLLHWLEALGWMQKVSEGILAIISLESIALVSLSLVY
jgi:NACHT domain